MRVAVVFLLAWTCVTGGAAAEEKKSVGHYGVEIDADNFSQKTPKDTLESVIKAIQLKKIDYLLAQLLDPAFVDARVKEAHNGKFEEMVKEVVAKLIDDPERVQQLRRFVKDGTWEEGEAAASAKLKDSRDQVFFKKIGERWFLENRKKSEK